ncbi:ribonuclease HII [Bacillus sp. B-jedd]|uniref:ribonuclease HII n=1 Tax=Bacillus sp. B-jedd TaxID=1476857 RepID=UPI00051560F8|nr:ribonuclease HII [Bacillus sp. B-jedd]CEG26811.1 ribonuclease HII [Bacillus sp. B-jedd]
MDKLSIREIEGLLALKNDEKDPFILEAEKDGRKGVQRLLQKWKKDRAAEKRLKEKFYKMTAFERDARNSGYTLIAGIDEAGRGPLAGPVVAAAVILPENFFLPGLDDSKKLPAKKREEYEIAIKNEAVSFGIAFVSAEEIDELNIYQATIKAMHAASAALKPVPDYLLVDAVKLDTPFPCEPIIKGDAKSVSIAAASILAKNARDRYMVDLAAKYPYYGFEKNMGYGTREHLEAIEKYGATPIHRTSFAPLKPVEESNKA